jgi:UDP-2,3-diacylglucosamine pyrophosphatase LpxH
MTLEVDMVERNGPPRLRLRTVFISDIHLGFKGCSAELLLDFLHHVEMDYLFLVGDIIDVWSMKKSIFWPQSHINVVRTILGKAKRGTKVVFVPGNHDDVFREFDGAAFGNLEIHKEYVHCGARGRRMLVLHGDEFDSVVKCSPWLAKLGSNIYDILLAINPIINKARRRFDLPHWSLSSYLKGKAKTAVQYIGSFEDAVAQAARKRGVDMVVCGHIHHAEIRDINGVLYCNDGDWVESCTSLVEDLNGHFRMIDWLKLREQIKVPRIALPAGQAPRRAGNLQQAGSAP